MASFIFCACTGVNPRLTVFQILANGEVMATVPLSATGTGHLPWKVCNFENTFNQTITVPNVGAGETVIIRAQTSTNAAGNIGWQDAGVIVGWGSLAYTDPPTLDSVDNGIHIAFAGPLSDTTQDAIHVYFGNRGPEGGDATLTETTATSLIFTGTILAGSTQEACEVTIQGPVSLGSTTRSGFSGQVAYGGATTSGVWYETAAGSDTFVLDTYGVVPAPAAQLVSSTTSVLAGSQAGWLDAGLRPAARSTRGPGTPNAAKDLNHRNSPVGGHVSTGVMGRLPD